METLHTIRKWLDKIVGTICIFLFALMVVVGSYQIITRFIFNNPSTISEELLTYSFAWMAMFATAYVFGKRDHMRMTFVVDKLAPAQRKVLEIVLEVLVIAFAAIVLIYGDTTFIHNISCKNKERDSKQAEYRDTGEDSLASGQYGYIQIHDWKNCTYGRYTKCYCDRHTGNQHDNQED